MSNYLKKLAYISNELEKIAMDKQALGGRWQARRQARIANGGWYPGKFMGRPNPVTGASAYAAPQPVQAPQPAPTPIRTEQIGKDYKPEPYRALGVATIGDVDPIDMDTATYDPFTFGVLPPPSIRDPDSWKFRDQGIRNHIADAQRELLRKQIDPNNAKHLSYYAGWINEFQDEYVRRYATLNGIDENTARARLRKRLYDTSNMQAIMEQAFNRADRSKKTRRLLNILTGQSVDDAVKWRTPGAGHERESYEDALKNMNALRAHNEQAAARPLVQPKRVAGVTPAPTSAMTKSRSKVPVQKNRYKSVEVTSPNPSYDNGREPEPISYVSRVQQSAGRVPQPKGAQVSPPAKTEASPPVGYGPEIQSYYGPGYEKPNMR